MTFANPHALWFLLLVPPALFLFFWWSARVRQRLMAQFIQARLLPGLISGVSPAREKVRAAALVGSAILLIVALARPQWGYDLEEVKLRGLDIVIAIDTSKSMLAEDIPPNRLERAKLAALDLMQQAKSDRLGLVAFAGTAFLQCPLTIDDAAFQQSLKSLDVKTLPQGGTAVAAAIETALTAYKEGDNYKVLVLFTDGEDHDSDAAAAARKAAEAGLRIFTIGIGSAQGELIRIKDAKGQSDYVRDAAGNVVKSHLNELLLREIATEANGFYLPLSGAKTIDSLYQNGLAPLPKSATQEKWVRRARERYHWPLALAILLLIGEFFFPERKILSNNRAAGGDRRQSVPATQTPSKTSALTGVTVLLFLLTANVAAGSPAKGLRDYRSGKYDNALKEFEAALQKNSTDPRLHFNAGTAAYRNQRFEQAAKHFDQTLSAPDLKLQQQAYYNLGNTLYHLGEQNPDAAKKSEAWEQSIKRYESSLKLNPDDADARFNCDFVKKKLEELKQQQQQQQKQENLKPSEEAKKAKAAADAAVQRRDYLQALQIMNAQLQRDDTTRFYQDYIQRLNEVNGVQTNHIP
jgi:Ca-activated chloride channel homolog